MSPERRDEAIRDERCYVCAAVLRERWDRYTGSCRRCVPVKLLRRVPHGLRTPLQPPVRWQHIAWLGVASEF